MGNLLRGECRRLYKSRVFRLCILLEILLNLWPILGEYEKRLLYDPYFLPLWKLPDELMSEGGALWVPVITGVFMVFFIGTEFRDKTLNNKLIYGVPRFTLYLCELGVCLLGTMLIYCAGVAVAFGVGVPLLGGLEHPLYEVAWRVAIGGMATLGFTALYHAVFLCVGRIALCAIFPLPLGVGLYFLADRIAWRLERPRYLTSKTLLEDGTLIESICAENPLYVGGFCRTLYELFYDLLPSGQLLRCGEYYKPLPAHPWRLLLYTLFFVALCGTAGFLLFRKKQLK